MDTLSRERGLEMTIRSSGGVTFTNQRRSQRILLAVPVSVSGQHADGTTFVERASTLIVNASGGLVALKEKVLVTQTLILKNENTNMETSCAVVNIERRANGPDEVGVEFFLPPIGPRAVQKQRVMSAIPKPLQRQIRPSNDRNSLQLHSVVAICPF